LTSLARTFTPAHRLHTKADYDRVYRNSRRIGDGMFAILICDRGFDRPRLGMATAARVVGNAVRRNRIKRLVRESFRHHLHELPNVDIVVNARAGARSADNASILRSLEHHWKKVGRPCAPS
jgi:ribonuclease P protein component